MMTRRDKVLFAFLTVLVDALMIYVGFFLAYQARQHIAYPQAIELPPFPYYWRMLFIQICTMLVTFFFYRLYHPGRDYTSFDKLSRIFVAVSIGTIVSTALTSFTYKNELDYNRGMIIYAWIFTTIVVSIGRAMTDTLRASYRSRHPTRVLLVGAGDIGRMILQKVVQSPRLGYTAVGFVDDSLDRREVAGVPVLGRTDQVSTLIREHDVDEVIIALTNVPHEEILDIISQCERERVMVRIFPDLFQIMASEVKVSDLDGLPLLTVRDVALRGLRFSC